MEEFRWPPTKEDLQRLYCGQKLSAAKIASAYGLKYPNPKSGETLVLYHLKKFGIARRDPAEHIRKVTPQMVDSWVRRYEAGESLKQIASGLVGPVTVWNHLVNRGVKLRDKVEAQIKSVSKHQRLPFAGDELEGAYLIGLRFGDFHVVRHGRAIRVRLSTTHPAMANLFESLFSRYGFVHKYPRRANLTGYEWTLECDLNNSFQFLLKPISIEELNVFSLEEFLAFLSGLFDAEGTIYLHLKHQGLSPELALANTNAKLLSILRDKLEELDVHSKLESVNQPADRIPGSPASRIWRLRTWRKSDVKKLLELVRVRHWEKTQKFKLALAFLLSDINADELEDRWNELASSIDRQRSRFVDSAEFAIRQREGRRATRMGVNLK